MAQVDFAISLLGSVELHSYTFNFHFLLSLHRFGSVRFVSFVYYNILSLWPFLKYKSKRWNSILKCKIIGGAIYIISKKEVP